MKVALFQTKLAWENPIVNRKFIEEYFLEEAELCTLISFDTLFKKKKVREIEKELTIQDLFNFMENNKK